MKRLPFVFMALAMTSAMIVPAYADRRGTGDGSITDRSRVKIHQRYPGDNAKRGPDRGYRYREKCYWYFKTTDGWWPTGATQRCERVRVE